MRGVVLTGGPGAGKTTLLGEFARLGFHTVSESAREVIAERVASGQAPRPDPQTFAREILRRDIERYLAHAQSAGAVFFDRCLLEALAMVREAGSLPGPELRAVLRKYPFHGTVFVLPPWQAIYRPDSERDHTFAHAERVHIRIVQWYRSCGYSLHEVPRVSVAERARHVLKVLAADDA